jgi:hypothetical protein
MPKVNPTAPSAQIDLGFESPEDIKAKKQTPAKTGPSVFDAKLEDAATKLREQRAQELLRQMEIDKSKAIVRSIGDEVRAEKKAELGRKEAGSGRAIYFSTDPAGSSSMGIKKMPEFKKGGKVSASSRADGIAQRGKTRGRIV